MDAFANEIKELRQSTGMTQKEYAEYLGSIGARTVENWEARGTSSTTMSLLLKISTLQKQVDRLEQLLLQEQMVFRLPEE